ncbi:MAG: methionine adenosyltransferase domain-containing protein [Candidatus Anstonellaceae archaeon]
MANGYNQTEHSEFKRLGHPDRLADHVASRVGAALLALDSSARFDVQCNVHFGPLDGLPVSIHQPATIVALFGQLSTKIPKATYSATFESEVRRIFHEVGYNGSCGSNPENILVLQSFNSQSEDIAAGIEKKGKAIGAGDATIANGYANARTENGLFVSHSLVQQLVRTLDAAFCAGVVPGLEADGKVQAEVRFDSDGKPHAKTIIVAAQHEQGINLRNFRNNIRELVFSANSVLRDSKGSLLNLVGRGTRIIVNGAGHFVKGGPLADTGVSGRMDTLYVSGGTQPHGGGLFFGRDGSKTDVSCLLSARNIALYFVQGGFSEEAKVTIEYAIGATRPSSVAVVLSGKGASAYSPKQLSSAVKGAFDLSPAGIANDLSLTPQDFRAFAKEGLFGVTPNGSHKWESIDREKLRILKQHLSRSVLVPVAAQVGQKHKR